MAIPYPAAAQRLSAQPTALHERMQRQLSTYWRVRISKTIERLEFEARRMLQLEQQLNQFASEYYHALGESSSRLTYLEQQVASSVRHEIAAELPHARAHCEMTQARAQEIKTRYRSLAKEMHPDLAVNSAGESPLHQMQNLNDAYHRGDLAALLRLEAQLMLTKLGDLQFTDTNALEAAVYDVTRAADTYAEGYRNLLRSPLNELMLRAISAQMEGWDWIDAVRRKIERAIEEKETELMALMPSPWVAESAIAAAA